MGSLDEYKSLGIAGSTDYTDTVLVAILHNIIIIFLNMRMSCRHVNLCACAILASHSERYTCMTFDRALSFRLGTSDDSRRDEAVQRSVVERAGERY